MTSSPGTSNGPTTDSSRAGSSAHDGGAPYGIPVHWLPDMEWAIPTVATSAAHLRSIRVGNNCERRIREAQELRERVTSTSALSEGYLTLLQSS